jgi:hypothetical protein
MHASKLVGLSQDRNRLVGRNRTEVAMATMPDEWYRQEARRQYAKPRSDRHLDRPAAEVPEGARTDRAETEHPTPAVGIEEAAPVSKGTNPGAWVQMWVWVPDPR